MIPVFARLALLLATLTLAAAAQDRPNVLWLTSEDHGPHLGAYGDDYATTPVLDALAQRGMLYEYAWSTAPVCAPARTTIISGVYPPALGAQHMRSMVSMPAYMKMYPQYLREAGYYATNNRKEDYNLKKPGQVWDESSPQAHWRTRKSGQPFFAIFNFTVSHESQIRKRPHKQVHDPAHVRVPAYHPDTPETRQDWAQYHDKITEVDTLCGNILDQLDEDGLTEDTIVFFYADHGPGLPRGKRWTYNSGLQVPLIVHFPDKWKHLAPPEYAPGGASDRQVGFIDLAPTLLSITGIEPKPWMQGRAFAGEHVAPARPYNFAFRGRMDERYDMVRAARDERFIYMRNYKPHKIYGQYIDYMFQTPTTQVWKRMYDQGKLSEVQSRFWETKPAEELYDLTADPDEINNLAGKPEYAAVVNRMRQAVIDWQLEIRDVGFLPEHEIHARAADATPYDMGHDDLRYPLARVLEMAQRASSLEMGEVGRLMRGLRDPDSAVRYWAALGALMREENGVSSMRRPLLAALEDEEVSVRIIAAQALGQYGSDDDAKQALEVLVEAAPIEAHSLYASMAALNAISSMGPRASSAKATVAKMSTDISNYDGRLNNYVPRLMQEITGQSPN